MREAAQTRGFFTKGAIGSLNGLASQENSPARIHLALDDEAFYVGRSRDSHIALRWPEHFWNQVRELEPLSQSPLRHDRKPHGKQNIYTKNGRPLQVSGQTVYSRSGSVVGRTSGNKVYGPNGRYVGTIAGDRLVYRSTDSAGVSSPFSAADTPKSARANAVGAAVWGDEPDIPD